MEWLSNRLAGAFRQTWENLKNLRKGPPTPEERAKELAELKKRQEFLATPEGKEWLSRVRVQQIVQGGYPTTTIVTEDPTIPEQHPK